MSGFKYKYFKICRFLVLLILHRSIQNCPQETLDRGIAVTWYQTEAAQNVSSVPLCYVNGHLLTRECNGTHWDPPLATLAPCTKVTKQLNYSIICPPGSFSITKNNSKYCYLIEPRSQWDNPCLSNGAASVITDLPSSSIYTLLDTLTQINISRYFWLPAKRPGAFLKPTWTIPGPNFGVAVKENDVFNLSLLLWKNCMLLDIVEHKFISDICTHQYPSICFLINTVHHPAKCPNGYYSFQFSSNSAKCYGVEFAKDSHNETFSYMRNYQCATAMGDNDKYKSDLVRFLFKQVASLKSMPQDYWCWFADMFNTSYVSDSLLYKEQNLTHHVVINSQGTLSLRTSNTVLPCIACETDVVIGETKLILEYNEFDKKLYLTAYHPSGLWRYDVEDKGIRCFSNVNGPTHIVEINESPFAFYNNENSSVPGNYIEKIIYTIELPRQTPAEYWCVGHTTQFTSIYTDKIVINPQGNDIHVFSLVFIHNLYTHNNQCESNVIHETFSNLEKIFQVENIILMDVLQKSNLEIYVFIHLQALVDKVSKQNSLNILGTFTRLKQVAITNLPAYNYTFVNISSATHCLPDSSEDIFTLQWDLTQIGHKATPKEFCLQTNGLPVIRHCNGSYIFGGFWGNIIGNCTANMSASTATTYLYNFVSGKLPEKNAARFLTEGLDFVLRDVDIIIPADVYYIAVSLEQISRSAQKNISLFELTDIQHMTWVMDRIMSLNTYSLRLAQTLNSTNMILDTVDNFIEFLSKFSQPKASRSNNNYELAVQPKFMVQISHPFVTNITGVAISRISSSNNFTDMRIEPLFKNTSIDYVMAINDLEMATWLPENLLLSLSKNETYQNNYTEENDLSLIITVFYDDSVFQQLKETECIVNSRIVGVSIPGYYSNLKLPLPLLFKDLNVSNAQKRCVFWDFNQHDDILPGLWSKNGCYVVRNENSITVCECLHMTHFGNLLINKEENPVDYTEYYHHMNALNIISLVGCFLSLVGLMGIWITALVFQTWRKKPGTKILLHLSVSVAIPLVIFVIFNLDTSIFLQKDNNFYYLNSSSRAICIILGVLIHYSIIASFLWMLITACLQYIRYVRVLGITRPKRFTIKLALIAWGLPAIPVSVVLLVDSQNYVPDLSNINMKGLICYPHGKLAITCVTIPVTVILVINILIFIRIIYAISRGPDGKKRKSDVDLVHAQMRLSILLFFLLGLTWTFGLFSFSKNYIWSYLFCLTSTMQGLVLFIYFVICDPSTRQLWVMLIRPQFVSTASRESITSF